MREGSCTYTELLRGPSSLLAFFAQNPVYKVIYPDTLAFDAIQGVGVSFYV